MPTLSDTYYADSLAMLARAREVNAPVLAAIAPRIAASLAAGGVLHAFGSGHSEMIAREIIGRAGGLMPVTGLFDPGYGFSENVVGYGTRLAQRHDHHYGLRAGETIIVISNSGKNASPIEVALYAKQKGVHVVGLTSVAMSSTAATVHPGGRNLHAVADHVLDNLGVTGDAITEIMPGRFAGPTSTFIGCTLLNLLMLDVIQWLRDHGHELPLVTSQNIPGGMEANIALSARYRTRLSKLIG
ncbi:MAG: sugar isomerase domain-containing protein [Opitutaceae bacterium]|nr:sugar isomerase domain-containing protein [Opitutaceae bacterium]